MKKNPSEGEKRKMILTKPERLHVHLWGNGYEHNHMMYFIHNQKFICCELDENTIEISNGYSFARIKKGEGFIYNENSKEIIPIKNKEKDYFIKYYINKGYETVNE